MSKFAVVDGDTVTFGTTFGAATVGPPNTTTITGSGSKLTSGAKVCVAGDEGSVSLPGVTYVAPPYLKPGTGTLTIKSLGSDQTAQKLSVNGKAVIVVGSTFTANFKVDSPAMTTPPAPGVPQPDATPSYSGTGQLTTGNTKLDSA